MIHISLDKLNSFDKVAVLEIAIMHSDLICSSESSLIVTVTHLSFTGNLDDVV